MDWSAGLVQHCRELFWGRGDLQLAVFHHVMGVDSVESVVEVHYAWLNSALAQSDVLLCTLYGPRVFIVQRFTVLQCLLNRGSYVWLWWSRVFASMFVTIRS